MSFALRALSIGTTILFFKFIATVTIQGGKRFAGGSRPPEDASLSLAKGMPQNYGQAAADEAAKMEDIRWQRIVLNDLENIPMGILVTIVALLAGGNGTAIGTFYLVFTAARCGHTISYAKELQPHRAIFWSMGILSMIAITLTGFIAAVFY